MSIQNSDAALKMCRELAIGTKDWWGDDEPKVLVLPPWSGGGTTKGENKTQDDFVIRVKAMEVSGEYSRQIYYYRPLNGASLHTNVGKG